MSFSFKAHMWADTTATKIQYSIKSIIRIRANVIKMNQIAEILSAQIMKFESVIKNLLNCLQIKLMMMSNWNCSTTNIHRVLLIRIVYHFVRKILLWKSSLLRHLNENGRSQSEHLWQEFDEGEAINDNKNHTQTQRGTECTKCERNKHWIFNPPETKLWKCWIRV